MPRRHAGPPLRAPTPGPPPSGLELCIADECEKRDVGETRGGISAERWRNEKPLDKGGKPMAVVAAARDDETIAARLEESATSHPPASPAASPAASPPTPVFISIHSGFKFGSCVPSSPSSSAPPPPPLQGFFPFCLVISSPLLLPSPPPSLPPSPVSYATPLEGSTCSPQFPSTLFAAAASRLGGFPIIY